MAMRISGVEKDLYFLMEDARTKPNRMNSQSEVELQPIRISYIPKVMRKIGWKKSAQMMDRWLNSPGWKCPDTWKEGSELPQGLYIPDQHCDDSIITMTWLMQYPSAVSSMRTLMAKACSPAAMKITAHRLKALGWSGSGAYTFSRRNLIGRPSMSARELEQKYQNNFELVGGNFVTHMFDTLDDIYGALGTYSLKVAVIGTAFQHTDGKRYLEAQWAGIYVKDFYDFNNNGAWDQPLGYWTDEGILRRADSAISTIAGQKIYFKKRIRKVSAVHNSDFLKYREATGKGGDFVVFSDVNWEKISGTYELPWEA